MIEFSRPFRTVRLQNHSDRIIETHLAYKNRSCLQTDTRSFMAQVNNATAPGIIERLHQQLTASSLPSSASIAEIALLEAELQRWRTRLSARYQSFIGQYPPMSLLEGPFLSKSLN